VLLALLASGGVVALPQSVLMMSVGLVLMLALGVTTVFVLLTLAKQRQTRQGLRELSLDHVDTMTGIEFERYVGAALEQRGFTAIRYTKARNDDGIDITAKLGKTRYAVQAKRYAGKVGKEHIFPVTSARDALGFDEAMVITNSSFTRGAKEYAAKSRCQLVERDELARWRAEAS
jgi:HJR/Mrr/RecB family endonuclease